MVRLESRRWKLKADSEGSAPSSASCSLLEKECGRKDRSSLTATRRRRAWLPDQDLGSVMGAQLNPRGGQGVRLNPTAQGSPGKIRHAVSQTQLGFPKVPRWVPEGDSLLSTLVLALAA